MKFFRKNWPIYLAVIAGFTGLSLLGSRAFGAVRDAGHGGSDGGAVSCTGARECEINLAITQRLDDLLHLLGCQTLQLRQGDTDLASADAASISEKKVTDLKNRVARINQQADGVLVSIHQNQFSQSQYRGAQVFYAPNTESRAFAALMQQNLRAGLDPANKRECKPGSGIFLSAQASWSSVAFSLIRTRRRCCGPRTIKSAWPPSWPGPSRHFWQGARRFSGFFAAFRREICYNNRNGGALCPTAL